MLLQLRRKGRAMIARDLLLPIIKAECRLDERGTLWVEIDDCTKVNDIIVGEKDSKFCRLFYMPTQRHGEWKYYDKDGNKWGVCSECEAVSVVGGNYCPNCGAKMDGGDNEK